MDVDKIYKLVSSTFTEDCKIGLYLLDKLDERKFSEFIKKYSIFNNHSNTDYIIRIEKLKRNLQMRHYFKGKRAYYMYYDNKGLMIDLPKTAEILLHAYNSNYSFEEL